jgi:hypothetical protein
VHVALIKEIASGDPVLRTEGKPSQRHGGKIKKTALRGEAQSFLIYTPCSDDLFQLEQSGD